MAEVAVAAAAAALLSSFVDRPVGWSDQALVEVKESPIHGRGVFARAVIPAGTTLGEYPGRVRSGPEMLDKIAGCPMAKSYVFRTDEQPPRFVDPTDLTGLPSAVRDRRSDFCEDGRRVTTGLDLTPCRDSSNRQ